MPVTSNRLSEEEDDEIVETDPPTLGETKPPPDLTDGRIRSLGGREWGQTSLCTGVSNVSERSVPRR